MAGNGEEWCARQGRVWSVHALLLQYIALVFQNDRKFPSLKPAMWHGNSMVHRGKVVLNCTARCGFWRFGQNPWKKSRGPSLNECGLQVSRARQVRSCLCFGQISKVKARFRQDLLLQCGLLFLLTEKAWWFVRCLVVLGAIG